LTLFSIENHEKLYWWIYYPFNGSNINSCIIFKPSYIEVGQSARNEQLTRSHVRMILWILNKLIGWSQWIIKVECA